MLRSGSSRSIAMRPASTTRSRGTFQRFATLSHTLRRSLLAASRHALPTISVIRELYAPRSTGHRSVSADSTRMSSIGSPSSSLVITASIVLLPWPMSFAPLNTRARPLRSRQIWTPACGMSFG
jgi:hypothetical protein